MTSWLRIIAAVGLLGLVSGLADAQSLRIGSRASPAIDPHYQWLSTNEAYSMHIFDSLVRRDPQSKSYPGLATEWKMLDPLTWEFKLRRGVRFHDGSEFTAEDVKFSFDRVVNLPNNPNPYSANIRSVAAVEIVDPYTVRFRTEVPDPLLPGPLATIYIVSHKAAKDAAPADFRSGRATIGTGPYKFVSYVNDAELTLARNEGYWDTKPDWERVVFKIISADSPRVAALLANDVDVIDFLPSRDVESLEKDARIAVFKGPSDRLMYLMLDVGRSPTPYATDAQGNPLPKNPFQDIRVRRAISLAIDRDAMVARVMEGMGKQAYQMMPEEFIGFDPSYGTLKYDPNRAKALLAEAGYSDGFGLTVHCSSNRYLNDAKVCQAVGQMLSRVGLKMKVETMPLNVYFPKIAVPRSEFSFILMGWGNSSTGTASGFLTAILHSHDTAKRMGHANRAYYSSPEYDRMVEEAVTELDDAKREAKMRAAVRYATDTYVTVPLYTQYTALATRKDLVATTRVDEMTLAMAVKRKP